MVLALEVWDDIDLVRPVASPEVTEERDRLLLQHMPLVRRLCERYRRAGVPMEDLIQVGAIGLLHAIDRFEPGRGTKFLAFAVPVVLGLVKNYLRDYGLSVRVPRDVQRHRQMVGQAIEYLAQAHGRLPTAAEVAAWTGLDTDAINDAMELNGAGSVVPLENVLSLLENSGYLPSVAPLSVEDPVHDGIIDRIDIANTLKSLGPREQTIIRLKFYRGLTQAEIAERMGMSQVHVSRLQRKALEMLRARLTELGYAPAHSTHPGVRSDSLDTAAA
ncbi:MAG: sigma-70 family RNA polymerase sigma factor [SAR202 cluster bacterium]|nr:sigma-70 family RNA polymerase sigma factor [SAR202 cluster bacterium]